MIVNSILNHYGYTTLPFTDEFISQVVSDVMLIGWTFWGFWKNNSFSQEAIKADEYMKELKNNGDSIE